MDKKGKEYEHQIGTQPAETDMVPIIVCCAGLDVHKKTVVACVRRMVGDGHAQKQTRAFGTMTREIQQMGDWLASEGVTDVVMESTGVFWKPIWNLLEGRFNLMLCNAQHVKQVPGRKTDTKDCEWLAQLLQHGLLRGSFVPARPQRDLRDLTRSRAQLVSDITRVANRIQKVLEDANIKLGSVASDVLGVSGRAILEAMTRGEEDPNDLAELARRRLRGKIPELRNALAGHVREHHRFLLARYYQQLKDLEYQVGLFDERIESLTEDAPPPSDGTKGYANQTPCLPEGEPLQGAQYDVAPTGDPNPAPLSFEQAVTLLDEIPGIDHVSARSIIAELGVDMNQFPSAGHASSWAGISPGNNESAGKRKSGKTTKGNRWFRRAINQVAWAASHTKSTYFSAFYKRIAARRGKKRAIVALGHALLTVIYHMLKTHDHFHDLGADYFDNINHASVARYHKKRLQQLGYEVTLQQVEATA